MGLQFNAASNQHLELAASPPLITVVPLTIGMWVYPTTTGTRRDFFGLSNDGNTSEYMGIHQAAANTWAIYAGTSAASTIATGGAVTANQWAFLIARFVASDNRKLDVLESGGAVTAVTSVVSRVTTGINKMTIGSTETSAGFVNPFTGILAEFWYTNTDIQADGGALDAAMLRQLAYGGPFSVPHVAANVVEYRSFLASGPSNADDPEEIYFGKSRSTGLANSASPPTCGPHPPLPHWYRKPKQASQVMIF